MALSRFNFSAMRSWTRMLIPIIDSTQYQQKVWNQQTISLRQFSATARSYSNDNEIIETDTSEPQIPVKETQDIKGGRLNVKIFDVDTSIRYMHSKAYKMTYGDVPVWVPYRRNYKGHFLPKKTRKTCIRAGQFATGNPCPLCRDEYLVVHHQNVELLKQFISPYTGQLLDSNKTGVCQRQHKNLQVEFEKAYDKGLIEMPVPFRKYDYSRYLKGEPILIPNENN